MITHPPTKPRPSQSQRAARKVFCAIFPGLGLNGKLGLQLGEFHLQSGGFRDPLERGCLGHGQVLAKPDNDRDILRLCVLRRG